MSSLYRAMISKTNDLLLSASSPCYLGKKFSHTTIGKKILHGLFKALLKARDFSSLKQDKHVICLLNKLSRHVKYDVVFPVLVQPNIQLFTYL